MPRNTRNFGVHLHGTQKSLKFLYSKKQPFPNKLPVLKIISSDFDELFFSSIPTKK